ASAQRAIRAMPPLPGAQTTSVTRGLRWTAHASACSRPPEPRIRTFIRNTFPPGSTGGRPENSGEPERLSSATRAGKVKRGARCLRTDAPYTGIVAGRCRKCRRVKRMTGSLIKPHQQQVAEQERREAQRRVFRRNQILGLLILAVMVCAWWI